MNQWIYIYFISDEKVIYDRTVSRSGLGPRRAEQVVKKFRDRGVEAFYTIGRLVKDEVYS